MKAIQSMVALIAATVAAYHPAAAQEPAQATSSVTVEAVLTTAVVDRVAQDTVSAIPAPAPEDTLYLWTRVSGAAPGAVIHHVWSRGGEQVADVELTVNGSPWRTWSRKTITADMTGAWRVEVRDATGTVLQTIDFTVGQ